MLVRFKFNHWYPKTFRIAAITLYPYILFNSKTPSLRLVKHEFCHVKQIREIGYKFYLFYIFELVRNLFYGMSFWTAYANISYEIEAREYEKHPLTPDELAELTKIGFNFRKDK